MRAALRLDEDFHVHSTFSDDGASTLAQNVASAQERGLGTLCLADHVRRDTAWLPEFLGAVSAYRRLDGLAVLAGVEAKILDASGQLDLPPGLRGRHADAGADAPDGLDLILIADHQFPGEDGPLHPARLRAAIEQRELPAQDAIEQLVRATVRAAAHVKESGIRPLVAHLFSLLPKAGLAEDQVPPRLLRELASKPGQQRGHRRGQREVAMPLGARDRRKASGRPGCRSWPAATATIAVTSAATHRCGPSRLGLTRDRTGS